MSDKNNKVDQSYYKKSYLYQYSRQGDKILQDIKPDTIPPEYISYIEVEYKDGTTVELGPEHFYSNITLCKDMVKEVISENEDYYDDIHTVKIYTNSKKLEKDLNKILGGIYRNYTRMKNKKNKS